MNWIDLGIVVFLGLVLGSFATALAYRLPRDISILKKKRSSCPHCKQDLCVRDLVPIFSYVCFGGKCRQCGAPIGKRYPLIELATLALCFGFYFVYGLDMYTWPVYLLAPVLVSMIDIDIQYKILPDSLNLALACIGGMFFMTHAFVYASPLDFLGEHAPNIIGGVLLYGLGSYLLRYVATLVLKKEPMGLGDVKFFAAAGVWLGLDLEAFSLFLVLSGFVGVVFALFWQKIKKEAEFPFGPSLIFAFIVILYAIPPTYG